MVPVGRLPWRGGAAQSGGLSTRASVLLATLFAILVAVGLCREFRVQQLTEPFVHRLDHDRSESALMDVAKAVSERFRTANAAGGVGRRWPFPFGTAADYLLTGGSCGQASLALGAIFDRAQQPFRIVQINVKEWGASHVMVESCAPDGRWILLAPLTGFRFIHPETGGAMTLEEVRALPGEKRAWIPPVYQGRWSLWGPVRRTNWGPLDGLREVASSVVGEDTVAAFSLRALFLEPGLLMAGIGAAGLVWLLLCSLAARLGLWRCRFGFKAPGTPCDERTQTDP